jgi:hypothetical protein
VWSDRASGAMGISAPAVFGRGMLIAALGRDRHKGTISPMRVRREVFLQPHSMR